MAPAALVMMVWFFLSSLSGSGGMDDEKSIDPSMPSVLSCSGILVDTLPLPISISVADGAAR